MTPLPADGSILLVEDDPDDIERILRVLAKHGVANPIAVATDGVQALDLLLPADDGPGLAVSLVVLDLHLPRIGGLDVLLAMRSDPRTEAIPVVVLTTSAVQRDLVAGYRLRCSTFVHKPLVFDEFSAAVRTLGRYWLLTDAPPHLPT